MTLQEMQFLLLHARHVFAACYMSFFEFACCAAARILGGGADDPVRKQSR